MSQGTSPGGTGIKGRRRHLTHDGDEHGSHGSSMEIHEMHEGRASSAVTAAQ